MSPKANNVQEDYKDAVLRNIQAVSELSELVQTSFGPNRSNKLFINHLGRLFVTSDAATIIEEVEVVHPAAKLLVKASQAQESEMGDATNTVIIFAGELLKKAERLLIKDIHPSEIIKGYELACKQALVELEDLSTSSLPSPLTQSSLAEALKPAIASKQFGFEDALSALVAEAALAVMPNNPVDNVRVVKIMNRNLSDTCATIVQGMVFGREPEGVIKKVTKAKVAIFTSALDIEQHMEKIFKEIADAGVKVIIAGSAVSELALHYLNRFKIAVLKIISKFDLRRISRIVNAKPLARIGAPTPDEAGHVDVFETTEISGDRVTVLRQVSEGNAGYNARTEKTRMATIVLSGATANHLDDLGRAIDSGVNMIKSLFKDPRLVPGAGATELELGRRMEAYGSGLRGLSLAQHIVKRYATALEVFPRTLAENALGGAKGNQVVGRLWEKHQRKGGEAWGVDVKDERDGTLVATDYKILDSLAAKSRAIKLGTEAAISVLSVDIIMATTQQSLRRVEDEQGKALAHNQRLIAELESKDIKLQHVQAEHDELTALLKARTRELQGSQIYLTKADTLSGAEVISLIDALNVEILQTSAFISDSFDFARPPVHPDERKEASTRISEVMGPTLKHLLDTVLHSKDPFLVQIALQGAIVKFSHWIIMTWDFDGLQAEQPLAEIYNDIRETESQAVGGRWRALTRAHAQKVALQKTDLHAEMVTRISDRLVIILVAAGCTKSHQETYRIFTQKFSERVSELVEMSSRLNKAMGEEVTSADLWPTTATSGDEFNGTILENFDTQAKDSEGKAILCTTALGLQRSEKVVQGNVSVEFKTTTLLKPKVALESVADTLERDGA